MPHPLPNANHGTDGVSPETGPGEVLHKHSRQPSLLTSALQRPWTSCAENDADAPAPQVDPALVSDIPQLRLPHALPGSECRRRAIPSQARPQTLNRQESERRDRLLEVAPSVSERRAMSVDRRPSNQPDRTQSADGAHAPSCPKTSPRPRVSAPDIGALLRRGQSKSIEPLRPSANSHFPPPLPPLLDDEVLVDSSDDQLDDRLDRNSLNEEHDRRWILNLSMHFRDRSNREKFFVTYAEKPNLWRRVTISLDYRDAPPDSLEADLSTLEYQRDKSFRIYDAIRESLPEIQYYDTVTNLKLETTPEDGQLHVHVREDVNETIHYPAISLFNHVRCPRFNEAAIDIDAHLSGFVYRVQLDGRTVIKKEIPGPDTVDEFIYEVNALDALSDSPNVIQLEGLVTNDRGTLVKGLLISYAPHGALVDMIYDFRGSPQLPWHRREKWARQIVSGLRDVHEAGFVQGDFTLTNIVIDEDDNALVIDINRRGCPVGWEPPELSRLIESGQRIGMCISTKTDLFQLGMVLWALAEEVDEPERVERPLPPVSDDIPSYFRAMVATCLSDRPQDRLSAKDLSSLFPESAPRPDHRQSAQIDFATGPVATPYNIPSIHRADKEYINPATAVTLDDLKNGRESDCGRRSVSPGQVSYLHPGSDPASTLYQAGSCGSWAVGRPSRGRSPVSSRRRSSPCIRSVSSATSVSAISPCRRRETCPYPAGSMSAAGQDYNIAPIFSTELDPPLLIGQDDPTSWSNALSHKMHLLHTDSGFVDGT